MPMPSFKGLLQFGGFPPLMARSAPRSFPHAATLQDNFDDNSLDTSKWSVGLFYPPSYLTTGVSVTEVNQRVQITLPSSTASRSSGYVSTGLYDFTGDAIFVHINLTALQTGDTVGLSFGQDGNNLIQAQVFGASTLSLEQWVSGSRVTNVSGSWGTDVWLRLRHVQSDGTIKIDTAPATASNPPIETDWVNRISAAFTGNGKLQLQGGKIAFFARANGTSPATPTTIQFDGFNTATAYPQSQATGSGTLPLDGSATATVEIQGIASGSLPLTGAATGAVKLQAAANGNLPLTGSATAKVKIQGAAVGTLPLSGSEAGAVRDSGTASGAIALTGSAAGKLKAQGAAVGTLPLTGSASSRSSVQGTGSGSLDFTGSAAGTVKIRGGANDNLPLTGSATGAISAGLTLGPVPTRRTRIVANENRTGVIAADASTSGVSRAGRRGAVDAPSRTVAVSRGRRVG